jgi:hypothetical protein
MNLFYKEKDDERKVILRVCNEERVCSFPLAGEGTRQGPNCMFHEIGVF